MESTLLELRDRFSVREVRFDPYQMVATAQRLTQAGVPMVEFAQSVPNLTEASNNLYETIKGGNLLAYCDDQHRLAVHRSVAIETSRGWRIAKTRRRTASTWWSPSPWRRSAPRGTARPSVTATLRRETSGVASGFPKVSLAPTRRTRSATHERSVNVKPARAPSSTRLRPLLRRHAPTLVGRRAGAVR